MSKSDNPQGMRRKQASRESGGFNGCSRSPWKAFAAINVPSSREEEKEEKRNREYYIAETEKKRSAREIIAC